MNTAVTIQPSRLPISPAVAKEFSLAPTEWRVLVEQIFPAAKSVESVMMALAYCRKRNLDIFKKPVHIVPMWSSTKRQMVETVWPGIAEIRTTAARTGEYAGIDAVEFGPMLERSFKGATGGNQPQDITKDVRFPEWASVVVYRIVAGQRCAYHAKVFWEETYASVGKTDVPNDMWAKRPRGQLDKCVEAAALRKAFPEELGNIYAAEEMEGRTIDGEVATTPTATTGPKSAPRPPEEAKPSLEQLVQSGRMTVNEARAEVGMDPTVEDAITEPIEVITEDGEVVQAVQESEPFDPDSFVDDVKAWLEDCVLVVEVDDVWNGQGVETILKPYPDRLSAAQGLKRAALNRVGG